MVDKAFILDCYNLPADVSAFRFGYTNYEGKFSYRAALPLYVRFSTSPWHSKPQWLLHAFDLDRGETRDFAMNDMDDDASHLRHWLHRIDEATNSAVADTPLSRAVNAAALAALSGQPAHETPGLDVEAPTPGLADLTPLSRGAAAEVLQHLRTISQAIEGLPYRDATPLLAEVRYIRNAIHDTFPGGFLDNCEGCSAEIGWEDPHTHDNEDGITLCASCGPTSAPAEATAPKVKVGEWLPWDGSGACPIPDGTACWLRFATGEQVGPHDVPEALRWEHIGQAGDIVAYRVDTIVDDDAAKTAVEGAPVEEGVSDENS